MKLDLADALKVAAEKDVMHQFQFGIEDYIKVAPQAYLNRCKTV